MRPTPAKRVSTEHALSKYEVFVVEDEKYKELSGT